MFMNDKVTPYCSFFTNIDGYGNVECLRLSKTIANKLKWPLDTTLKYKVISIKIPEKYRNHN